LISAKRCKKSQNIYSQINNKSPLLDITNSQADELARELSYKNEIGEVKIFVIMRYAPPFSKEVVKEIEKYQPKNLVLLPLYPQFSTTTSESSILDFSQEVRKNSWFKNNQVEVRTICCYPISDKFIRSHVNLIKQSLAKISDIDLKNLRLLFSAHGLPKKIIDAGDPYVFQVNQSTEKIIDQLAADLSIDRSLLDYQVCYQSKVGPLEWTKPSLDFEINRAAIDKKDVAIIPISFVSDHSETLVELDIDYKKTAQELGIKNYLRVASLNNESFFIQALAEICEIAIKNIFKMKSEAKIEQKTVKKINKIDEEDKKFDASNLNIEPMRICPKNMKKCLNQNFCSNA
jgi:ferrochelatase